MSQEVLVVSNLLMNGELSSGRSIGDKWLKGRDESCEKFTFCKFKFSLSIWEDCFTPYSRFSSIPSAKIFHTEVFITFMCMMSNIV